MFAFYAFFKLFVICLCDTFGQVVGHFLSMANRIFGPIKTWKNQRKLIFWGWHAVRLLWVYRILHLWSCSCCIDFNMLSRFSKTALPRNTGKIYILAFPFPQKPSILVFWQFVRVVFIFKKHPLPTFSLSVSCLENTAKICFFGLRYVSTCFRAFFGVFEFWRFFFLRFW